MMDSGRRIDWFVRRGIVTEEALGYFLETAAGYWPEREMVSFGDARYTYLDMHRWSLSVAHMLIASGVARGDTILIQGVNSAEILVVQFAAWRIGAITVPIVPMYRAHELKSIIADVSPRAIVSSGKVGSRCYCSELDEVLDEMGQRPILRMVMGSRSYRDGWVDTPAFSAAGGAPCDGGLPEPAGAWDCAVILFTSGSTAAPKGAMLRGGAIVNNGRAMQKIFGISAGDVALCATPLGHTGALINSMIVPMVAGARAVVMPSWKPDEAVELIERERVTFMGAPPLILQDLIERYEASDRQGHRIQRYVCGGGAMPPSLIERADAVGIKASRNYGMTETTGTIAACHADAPIARRAHFDGQLFYGSEVEIVDDQRRPLSLGKTGEIRIRCPLMMIGYTDPKLNEAQLDAEGWFYTGDLGRLDDDDWLTFEGRTKDIINRGGEKFSSQDIEAAIASFPGIADVAVVGAPHPRFGEVVAAFIRLKPGAVWIGPEPVLDHLEQVKLAKAKRPVQWHVLEEFPRTPSGKVQKQGLRELLRS
jgi:acyl-CoA synthetase (AMP-forming)/AMP-acid ligase II